MLNAFVMETPDRARDMARGADGKIAKSDAGRLDDIPRGVKDRAEARGGRTTPATPAAAPPDEPPATSVVLETSRRHGLPTGPKHEVSFAEPIANSSLLSLPSITAPSRQSCEVTVDS